MICQARLSPLSAGADSKAGKVAMSAFASLASSFLFAALCKAAASALCCLAATLAAYKHAAVNSCYERALESSVRQWRTHFESKMTQTSEARYRGTFSAILSTSAISS